MHNLAKIEKEARTIYHIMKLKYLLILIQKVKLPKYKKKFCQISQTFDNQNILYK